MSVALDLPHQEHRPNRPLVPTAEWHRLRINQSSKRCSENWSMKNKENVASLKSIELSSNNERRGWLRKGSNRSEYKIQG